jgi:hypothetical protein
MEKYDTDSNDIDNLGNQESEKNSIGILKKLYFRSI